MCVLIDSVVDTVREASHFKLDVLFMPTAHCTHNALHSMHSAPPCTCKAGSTCVHACARRRCGLLALTMDLAVEVLVADLATRVAGRVFDEAPQEPHLSGVVLSGTHHVQLGLLRARLTQR